MNEEAEIKRSVLMDAVVPIGGNLANIRITGVRLEWADLEALGEFVEFAKRQFARKERAEAPENVKALPTLERIQEIYAESAIAKATV
jgi:hypothetical protein